jgi:hypothetical protein
MAAQMLLLTTPRSGTCLALFGLVLFGVVVE